eukprot:GHUV01000596.1.p1 GENE.GHUV01000596.1~~GHUV01000596.1.p1  ORF type:complete len:328 (+),score=157.40 GHUV01000596.1:205-1188(+)
MMPGMPGGAGGPFDFSALQSALNDPSIKQMAEQIANDPSFQGLTAQLQESMAGMMGGVGGEGAANGAPAMPPMPDPANFDPTKYMQAMSGMFQNPQFMQMAEKLGQAIIQSDPNMQRMMGTMQDPEYKAKVENAMKSLKDDPEMGNIFAELESGGPAAMMKYWNDPEVLKKLGGAMGDVFDFQAMLGEGAEGAEGAAEGDEAAEEEEEEVNVHTAASDGNVEVLKQLLDGGAAADEVDEEGRTALHFAVGYGEIACAKLLIEAGAKLDLQDNNKNTALHYAAGYGQAESVKLLVDSGADKAAKNADDKTALEVAQLNEQEEVAKLLE